MRCDPDAVEHWNNVRAQFASGERVFTVIKPQPLAHERTAELEEELRKLRGDGR